MLKGKNYAALANESTFEPIKVIQNIIEDANKMNKEAWIVLMGISKAYDSVSSFFLGKALERIKIPKNFMELIMDIAEDRHNQVMIQGCLSDSYYVEDGIDQGEVWSPLLWRIFMILSYVF